MSKTNGARRSIALRMFAAIGWVTVKLAKILWKVLALTGSRAAKRKLRELKTRDSIDTPVSDASTATVPARRDGEAA